MSGVVPLTNARPSVFLAKSDTSKARLDYPRFAFSSPVRVRWCAYIIIAQAVCWLVLALS